MPTLNKAFGNIEKLQCTYDASRGSSHCKSRGCSCSSINLCISGICAPSHAKATREARYGTPGQPANPVAQPVTQPIIMAVQEGPAAQTCRNNNYLIWSICNTMFCCFPLVIIAIIYSAMYLNAAKSGRREEARCNAIAALVLNILSTVFGVTVYTYLLVKIQLMLNG